MNFKTAFQQSPKVTFRISLLVIFLISLLCIFIFPNLVLKWGLDKIARFSYSLGTALLVALILTVTVTFVGHQFFSRELKDIVATALSQIKNEVFWAVLEKVFPESVYKIMRAQLFEVTFFRRDYRVDVTLEPYNDQDNKFNGEDLVKVWIYLSYKVKNLSTKEAEYKLDAYIDNYFEANFRFVKINGEEEQLFDKSNKDKMMLSLDKKVPIKSDEEIRVEVSACQLMMKTAVFPWASVYASEDLELTVFFQRDLDLCIETYPLHPGREETFLKTDLKEQYIYKCKIIDGLLPYQGVDIRWRPKKASKTSQATQ